LDSLGYLSLESLVSATHIKNEDLCLACFDGNYPEPVDTEFSKFCFEE